MSHSEHSISTVESDNSLNVGNLKIPDFSISNPRVWLLQVEAQFHARRITSQETKYYHVVAAIPTSVAEQLVDVLDPIPKDVPYDTLKAALLERTSASEERRLQQLLSDVELGDRTPSQLLRYMRSLIGSMKVDESLLRQLWLKRLPSNMTAILLANDPLPPLDSLAKMADKIHECFSPTVSQVATEPNSSSSRLDRLERQVADLVQGLNNLSAAIRSSRSRSRSRSNSRSPSRPRSPNSFCKYHQKYGDKARHCRQPCTYRPSSPRRVSGNLPASQ